MLAATWGVLSPSAIIGLTPVLVRARVLLGVDCLPVLVGVAYILRSQCGASYISGA